VRTKADYRKMQIAFEDGYLMALVTDLLQDAYDEGYGDAEREAQS
jgi:hypothetical protein